MERVRKNHGPDVPASHDNPPPAQGPLLGDQRQAHPGHLAYQRGALAQLRAVHAVCVVLAVDPQTAALDPELHPVRQAGQVGAIGEFHPPLQSQQGDGSIHQPAVYERQLECFGHPPADGRLARARRPIDSDNQLSNPTARRSDSTSASLRRRQLPGRSRPRRIGPYEVRVSSLTG